MIHSDGAKMAKKGAATSKPGEGPDNLDLEGKVLGVTESAISDLKSFGLLYLGRRSRYF